jgi:ribosomal protein S6--L-glutamate ligase
MKKGEKVFKLVILCNERQHEVRRLLQEAKGRGWEASVTSTSAFTEACLEGASALLIRSVSGRVEEAKGIAKLAAGKGIAVFDRKFLGGSFYNKLTAAEKAKKTGFFVPKTVEMSLKNIPLITRTFSPDYVVVKWMRGKRGRLAYKVRKENLREFWGKLSRKKKYVAQEFVEIDKELRCVVIGKKFMGAVEKLSPEWKKNLSRGARAKKARTDKRLREACLKAVKVFEVDIAGIDLGLSAKGLFLIEVNRSPGFRNFEKETGKNIAAEILRFVRKNS